MSNHHSSHCNHRFRTSNHRLQCYNRRMFFLRLWILAAFLVLPPAVGAQEEPPRRVGLAEVDLMIRAGAPGLAQRLVDESQPPSVEHPAWMHWERKRWQVLQLRRRWGEALARWRELPAGLGAQQKLELRTWRAEAALQNGDGEAARRQLRELIWANGEGAVEDGEAVDAAAHLAGWRRAVIRAYLSEGKFADARTAARRFHLEYRPDDTAWSLLAGRALLAADEAEEAVAHLAALQSAEARAMLLLGRLRSAAYTPEEVAAQAGSLREGLAARSALRRDLWLVTAEAAAVQNNFAARVEALEMALLVDAPPESLPLVAGGAAELLDAYSELAVPDANALYLVDGDYAPWLDAALLLRKTSPTGARAMFAHVIRRAGQEQLRRTAHTHFLFSLLAAGRAGLAFVLYGEGEGLGGAGDIPLVARYELAEKATAAGDPKRAAVLLRGLVTPPPEVAALDWNLRRAQIGVYGGDFTHAAQAVAQAIADTGELDEKQVDRVLQVIFDFQKVEEHETALNLMEKIAPRITVVQQKRELLYWTAQSESAAGRHARAAELYLRSAMMKEDGLDRWGQSARFRAAEELTSARLAGDARLMYESILRGVKEPAARASLRRRMEKLHLSPPPAAE